MLGMHPAYPLNCRRTLGAGFVGRLVVLISALVSVLTLSAAEPLKKSFDIGADEAERSLKEFAAQSGVDVLFASSSTNGVRTNAVKGEYTTEEAMAQLLAGTPLFVTRNAKTGALKVLRESDPNVSRAIAQDSDRPSKSQKADNSSDTEGVVTLDTFEVFGRKTLNMDIRRTADDAIPYVVFDRQAIEQSGASDLQTFFLKNLPSGGMGQDVTRLSELNPTSPGQTAFATDFNLRGLGSSQTLFLIDGRRMTGTAGNGPGGAPGQADFRGIPLSAIERIEVIATTASGIYGGSATGGVINIILRRDYSGLSTAFTYENAFDTDVARRRFEISGGLSLRGGTTRIQFFASYEDGNSLQMRDRDFAQRFYAVNAANVPAASTASIYGRSTPPLGATTNIRSTSGNLTLKPQFGGTALNSPFTSVPYGYAGPQSDNGAGLVSRAGQYNLDLANTVQLGGGLATIYRTTPRKSTNFSLTHDFSPTISAFIEGSWSEGTVDELQIPDAPTGFVLQVPATSPANPFSQQIRITTPLFGAENPATAFIKNSRLAAGVILKLPAKWMAEADVTYGKSSTAFRNSFVSYKSTLLQDIRSGAMPVFQDTNQYPINFGPYVDTSFFFSSDTVRLSSTVGSLRASGPVKAWQWMSGSILSTLVEYRNESYPSHTNIQFGSTNLTPARSQDTRSLAVEWHWPIIAEGEAKPGVRLLEIGLAARYDAYTSHTSTTVVTLDSTGSPTTPVVPASQRRDSANPTLALRYKPVASTMFRISYATGFLPPTISQLAPSTPAAFTSAVSLQDPQRGGEIVGSVGPVNQPFGGNPTLRPERSNSTSAGIVLTPALMPGLRLSVDWTRIDKRDGVTSPGGTATQATFEKFLHLYPNRVTRGPAGGGFSVGPITELDVSLVNIAEQRMEAIDYAIDYTLKTPIGTFVPSAKVTHALQLRQRETPDAAETELNDTQFQLKWRGTAGITWQYHRWAAAWNAQYYSSYFIDPVTKGIVTNYGFARTDRQLYHDVSVGYEFGERATRLLRGAEVRLTVNNLFNAEPPLGFASGGFPYYAGVGGDPRLANYQLSVRKQF